MDQPLPNLNIERKTIYNDVPKELNINEDENDIIITSYVAYQFNKKVDLDKDQLDFLMYLYKIPTVLNNLEVFTHESDVMANARKLGEVVYEKTKNLT